MRDLHPLQKKILNVLKANVDEPLTIRELQAEVGASSPSLVHHHIVQLEQKGFLRRNPSNPYDYQILGESPEKLLAYLNVYGMAQCGPKGSVLDGNPIDRISISSKALGFPASDAFIVKAKGTSMLPKINPGDLVIVKKVNFARNGDIVVCVNNGEVLIKKLQIIPKSHNKVTYNLISLNQDEYAPFPASEDLKIEGVVKGVLSYSV